MSNVKDRVIEGGFWGGLSNILARLGSLIISIILARFMLPENYGLYSLVISIAMTFSTFADLGLSQTLLRFFSMYKSSKATAYFQYILKLKLLFSIIVSAALLISAYPISLIFHKPELFLPLVLSSFFIFVFLLASFITSLFYSLKKIKYLGIRELIYQGVTIVLTLAVLILLSSKYYVSAVIIVSIISNIVILFIVYLWLKKIAPEIFFSTKKTVDKKQVLHFLGYTTISYVAAFIFAYVDTIILGFFVSYSFIGYYKVASALIFGIINLFTYLGLVLLPIFTSMEHARLEQALNKVLRLVFMITIPSTFGILALGNYFVRLLYGTAYLNSVSVLYIFAFLIIPWVPASLISILLLSRGKPKNIAIINLISLILNVILCFLTISYFSKISPFYAILASAVSIIIARFFLFFSLARSAKKSLNINIKKTIFIKPLIASGIMFICIYFSNRFIIRNISLGYAIIEILIGIAVYILTLILIRGLIKSDLEIIKKLPITGFFQKFLPS